MIGHQLPKMKISPRSDRDGGGGEVARAVPVILRASLGRWLLNAFSRLIQPNIALKDREYKGDVESGDVWGEKSRCRSWQPSQSDAAADP
jgi:hypothetical protein